MNTIKSLGTVLATLTLSFAAASPALAFQNGSMPDHDMGCQFYYDANLSYGGIWENDGMIERMFNNDGSAGNVQKNAGITAWNDESPRWTGLGSFDNELSALYVPTGCYAQVWEHPNGGGATVAFPPGYYEIAYYGWNDIISTVECNCNDPRTAMSFSFDGVNDYAQAPSDTWFPETGFTISAWVKVNAITYWARIIDFGNGAGQDNVILAASNGTTGRPRFSIWRDGVEHVVDSPVAIPTWQWTHIAAVYSSVGLALYINGDLVSNNWSPPPRQITRNNNYIAMSNWSSDGDFHGGIADLRIIKKAMTQESLRALISGTDYPDINWTSEEAVRYRHAGNYKVYDTSINRKDATYHY